MLLRSISLCAALVAPLLAQLPATAAADAAVAYREAWQRFDAEFVDDEGEALFLPDAPLEDDRWIPLLAPSRRSLEAFLAAAAVDTCGFVPAAPGELCESATRLFATTALVRLAGAHGLHGRLELLDAARAQLAFSRHVRGFGDAMAATVSTSCEL